MKFLFVLVFCFCSLFGRTFDDIVDDKHEELMLEVYKGQEYRYYRLKNELNRRISVYPKEYLSVRNCTARFLNKGLEGYPDKCRPPYILPALRAMFDRSFFRDNEVDYVFGSKIFLEMKMRGTKLVRVDAWIHYFKEFPDLHKNWIRVCRTNCGLSINEQAVKKPGPVVEIRPVSPATSTNR